MTGAKPGSDSAKPVDYYLPQHPLNHTAIAPVQESSLAGAICLNNNESPRVWENLMLKAVETNKKSHSEEAVTDIPVQPVSQDIWDK